MNRIIPPPPRPETHPPGAESNRAMQMVDGLLERIRGEYLEMPGLRLTAAQAGRLWNLDAHACEGFLSNLVNDGFLLRTADGAYLRTDSPRRRPAR